MTLTSAPRAVVVDASVAVAVLGNQDARWVNLWTEWAQDHALVLAPRHFPAEVANALLRSVSRPAHEVEIHLGRLWRSGVEPVDRGLSGLLEAVSLADQHGLTVYDALYLQLALDVEGELATLDGDLAAAARAEGVTLVA